MSERLYFSLPWSRACFGSLYRFPCWLSPYFLLYHFPLVSLMRCALPFLLVATGSPGNIFHTTSLAHEITMKMMV